MLMALRVTLTIILVPIAAFCCFGFLASAEAAEPQAVNAFRLFYGAGVLAGIGAIAAVWIVKRK